MDLSFQPAFREQDRSRASVALYLTKESPRKAAPVAPAAAAAAATAEPAAADGSGDLANELAVSGKPMPVCAQCALACAVLLSVAHACFCPAPTFSISRYLYFHRPLSKLSFLCCAHGS